MSAIHLHAEVLTNIRQVSLYAELQSSKNEETRIDISSDKTVISVTHDGECSSIYLPTQISGTAQVDIPVEKRKEITMRLEIEDVSTLAAASPEDRSTESPWTAHDLTADAGMRCKSCSATIVEPGNVQVWQDLPSDTWYEMMDYWHCHKPHDDSEEQHHAAESKGYAASSRIRAKAGSGYVDTGSFLIAADDTVGLENRKATDNNDTATVHCAECKFFVGWHDTLASGQHLHKARLLVKPNKSSTWESFPPTTFICAQLLVMIESQATRKFVIHCDMNAYLVWVFNPDIHYSSSTRGPQAYRAMKVFYQDVQNPIEMLNEQSTTLEELRLPLPLFEDFAQALRDGTEVLPRSARTFQQWKVALLDRYERHASTLMDQNPLTKTVEHVPTWPQGVEGIEGIEGLLE